MKNIIIGILSLAFIFAVIGCAEDTNPRIRVRNERQDKANVQIQTSGGNTININEVLSGQTTEYLTVIEGMMTATAVIQKEPVSPVTNFFGEKNNNYTIIIQMGNPPTLRAFRE